MSEAIYAALITGVCAVVANIIIAAKNNRELYSHLDKQSELADERIRGEIAVIHSEIGNLSEQVKKHNSMVERTYKLEESAALHEAELKRVNHRICDLEKGNVKEAG